MNLEKYIASLGNFGAYKPQARIIRPERLIYAPKSALKLYSLLKEDTPRFNHKEIRNVKEVIKNKTDNDDFNPYSGFGFAIVSENVLNISVWGGSSPSLVHPRIYSFKDVNSAPDKFVEEDIAKEGAYCVWETAILQHEARAWRKYLFSEREDKNKTRYLTDLFEGSVDTDIHAG